MPDVMDLFPDLRDRPTLDLQARRNELIALPDPKSDPVLQELVCILRILRGRASESSRSGRPSSGSGSSRKVTPTVDML